MPSVPDYNILATGIGSMLPPVWRDLGLLPTPGETLEAWEGRLTKFGNENPQHAQAIKANINSVKTNPNGMGAEMRKLFSLVPQSYAPSGPASPQTPGLDRNRAVNDFYRRMMDPNAPELKSAHDQAANKAQGYAAARGVSGPLATSGIAGAGIKAQMGLATQRAGMGIAALQGGMNYDLNKLNYDKGLQGQLFDQDQSERINRSNSERAGWQAIASAGGQVVSGLAELGKNSPGSSSGPNYGNSNYYTGNYDGAAQMP